jgi:hypothetical protein
MQSQPPDRNNPANPLIKVAALDIQKNFISENNFEDMAISATLNFKKSSDMRGRAKTFDGDEVTVSFSLALRRASLEFQFSCEKFTDNRRVVDIKNVAFKSALVSVGNFSQTINSNSGRDLSAEVGMDGQSKAHLSSPDANLTLSAKASASFSRKISRDTRYQVSFECSNIKATSAGNSIHWEIFPKNTTVETSLSGSTDFLEGEVFSDQGSNAVSCACFVKKRDNVCDESITVNASVSTSIKDLIIDEVEFHDDLGNRIEPGEITREDRLAFRDLAKNIVNKNELKKSLLKSIIKKHLVSQGMHTDGALVEICRANS